MSMRMAVRRLPAVWMKQVRWDEYDGGAYDRRRRKKGWNCGPCHRI